MESDIELRQLTWCLLSLYKPKVDPLATTTEADDFRLTTIRQTQTAIQVGHLFCCMNRKGCSDGQMQTQPSLWCPPGVTAFEQLIGGGRRDH